MEEKYLFFWGHNPGSNGKKACLSNWYRCSFIDSKTGIGYISTEQYMMQQKALLFKDKLTECQILSSNSPRIAKQLGRQVKNFDEKIWEDKARDIVYDGCLMKFSQNPTLKEYLLSTNDKILVEASPHDPIWGIGLSGINALRTPKEKWGKNWLGECLMRVRDTLKTSI